VNEHFHRRPTKKERKSTENISKKSQRKSTKENYTGSGGVQGVQDVFRMQFTRRFRRGLEPREPVQTRFATGSGDDQRVMQRMLRRAVQRVSKRVSKRVFRAGSGGGSGLNRA